VIEHFTDEEQRFVSKYQIYLLRREELKIVFKMEKGADK